jgi:hypothetical protein
MNKSNRGTERPLPCEDRARPCADTRTAFQITARYDAAAFRRGRAVNDPAKKPARELVFRYKYVGDSLGRYYR